MRALVVFTTIVLSIFSTGVMSYIAMATPIGPWIAPTLVLISSLFYRLFRLKNSTLMIALTTAGGSIGGILATAFGFSFPTLYFLDQSLFNVWMAQPIYFAFVLSFFALAAGSFGFLIATMLEKSFIVDQQMAFPIGQLVYKMIAAHNQARKAYELVAGFVSATIFSFLQGGFFGFAGIIPRSITLLKPRRIGMFTIPYLSIRLDVLPMLLAIGFIAGHLIAIPLAVGAVSKMLFVDPVNAFFFSYVRGPDFVLAFCSGMVVVGALQSFLDFPKLVRSLFNSIKNGKAKQNSFFKEFKKAITIS